MARIADSDFNARRQLQALLDLTAQQNPNGRIYSFQNDNDETVMVNPTDIQECLYDYIQKEISKYPELATEKIKKELEHKLATKIFEMEKKLFAFVSEKMDRITQEIVTSTNKRLIEAQVRIQVDERIEKIKKLL